MGIKGQGITFITLCPTSLPGGSQHSHILMGTQGPLLALEWQTQGHSWALCWFQVVSRHPEHQEFSMFITPWERLSRSYASCLKSFRVNPAVSLQDAITGIGGSFRTKLQTGRLTMRKRKALYSLQRSLALMVPSTPPQLLLSHHFTSVQG